MKAAALRTLPLVAWCVLMNEAVVAQELSFIADSTVVRYSYVLEESQFTEIEEGVMPDQIDVLERDNRYSEHNLYEVVTGYDSENRSFTEVRTIEYTPPEEWIKPSYLQLISPTKAYEFDRAGNLISEVEMPQPEGFPEAGEAPSLLLTRFPTIESVTDDFQARAGFEIVELDNEVFMLKSADYSLTIDPIAHSIEVVAIYENRKMVEFTQYTYLSPYGYVVESVREEMINLNYAYPVHYITESTYRDHAITDPMNRLPKSEYRPFLEVQPNPVEGDYRVAIVNAEIAEVNSVVVKDAMGNQVYVHTNPKVVDGVIHLNASEYPSGVLVLVVIANDELITTTITKP